MGAGIPGTGMATLFYIISVFLMPLREIVPTLRGQSSWARWRLIARHLVMALAMTAAAYGTYRYVADEVLPPDTTIGGVSALAATVVLFVVYLMVVNLLALLVPGKVELPQSKAFPERRRAVRAEGPAPLFHPHRGTVLRQWVSTHPRVGKQPLRHERESTDQSRVQGTDQMAGSSPPSRQ